MPLFIGSGMAPEPQTSEVPTEDNDDYNNNNNNNDDSNNKK